MYSDHGWIAKIEEPVSNKFMDYYLTIPFKYMGIISLLIWIFTGFFSAFFKFFIK
jgi:hypothetical protein